MGDHKMKTTKSLLAGIVAALGFAAVPADAAMLVYDVGTVGGQVSVTARVTDLGSEIVSGYDLDLLFDDSVLDFGSLTFSLQLGDNALFETIEDVNTSTPGLVDFASLSLLLDDELDVLQTGDVTLATILFDVVDVEATDYGFAFVYPPGNDIKGRDALQIIPPKAPEPGTAALFAAALGAGAAFVRRRNRR
jgi:hypothetical protein